jgi:lysophospholipase L1-like esterase
VLSSQQRGERFAGIVVEEDRMNYKSLIISFVAVLAMGSLAVAQASRPTTQAARGLRGPRTPAPQSVSPRDALPFTPADYKSLKPGIPSIIIAGDSTADKGPDAWHRGWAAMIVDYFDTNKVNVVNLARGGRSARSFLHEGLWDKLLAGVKPGDYVFIQFGHNDGGDINNPNGRADLRGNGEETKPTTRPDGTTEIVHTFGWYNRKFIDDIKAKGANPILMSATVYNRWNNGKFVHQPGDFAPVLMEVARQENVPFIDHTAIIGQKYDALGQTVAAEFFKADGLHTTTYGGIVNAECFVAGVKQLNIPTLVNALNDRGQAIAAYTPSP